MAEIKINEILLEKYLLAELPHDLARKLKEKIDKDVELQKKIKALKESNKMFFAEYPEDEIFKEIELEEEKSKFQTVGKMVKKPGLIRRLMVVTPVLATLILVFVLIIPGILTKDSNPNKIPKDHIKGSDVIPKKQTRLLIFRKNNQRIETLNENSFAEEGDLLQLAYVNHSQNFGIIFSVDGGGQVTLLFPEGKEQSAALQMKKRVYLSHSYTLDSAPNFERFFLVTSQKQIDVDGLLERVILWNSSVKTPETTNLNFGEAFQEFSILIKKVKKK